MASAWKARLTRSRQDAKNCKDGGELRRGQASSGVGRGMAVALKAGGAANAREWTQMGGPVRGVSSEVLRGAVVGLEGGAIRRSTQIRGTGEGVSSVDEWEGGAARKACLTRRREERHRKRLISVF